MVTLAPGATEILVTRGDHAIAIHTTLETFLAEHPSVFDDDDLSALSGALARNEAWSGGLVIPEWTVRLAYDERILGDDEPVHGGYPYVADGKVVPWTRSQSTVAGLKAHLNVSEVRACAMDARLKRGKL